MVKFSKELEAQLIPEWKEAFVNYWQLKKNVKKIKLSRKPSKQCTNPQDMNSHFGQSIFDPVRYAITHISAKVMSCAGEQSPDIIQVRSRKLPRDEEQPQDEDEDEGEVYETELLHLFSEEDEVRAFFEILDAELNKVNRFYRIKEIEFLERGESLSKQLQTLLDLNQVRADRRRKAGMLSSSFSSSVQSSNRSSHRGSTDSSVRSSDCGSHRSSDYSESFSFSNIGSQTDGATPERGSLNLVTSAMAARTRTQSNYGRPAKTADAAAMTPQRAITAATTMLWEDLVKNPKKEGSGHADFMSRKKVQCAEKMIRNAFVELYKGLGLLKTYSTLNMVAFTKILKKFDKVSNQQASASYLKAVKRSHFISSDKVVRLMDEVESLFTKHFANSDRKKAMKFLRPQQQKDSHMVTFFVGLFTGCFVTLFSVYAILAHLSGMFSAQIQEKAAYMETIYPVFSMFALLSLHVFMYGCNLFMWKSTRINYNFIFEFSSATSLKYRDAFLICTSFMTAVVGAMVVHLILRESGVSPGRVDAIPGILLLVFTVLLICPFNILYHSTRYCFLRVIRNIVCSPFYKVLMVDFFMADQLTSQIPLLRHMESTACYFLAGSFKTHQYETCKSGRLYRELAYVISFMPYYWRAMQCARRWFDECDANHLLNLGKYVSAMVAAGARLTYARQPTNLWMAIVLVTSVIATLYQLYWDFAKDWGFFKPNSRNPWLRDDLILKNKSIYYISIALNLVLRVAWVETVIRFRIGMFETRMLDFFLASLEVIRRGHWNFYRYSSVTDSNRLLCFSSSAIFFERQ